MPGSSPELGQEPIDIPSDHSSMDDSDSDTSTERSFYMSIDAQIPQSESEDDEMHDSASVDDEHGDSEVQPVVSQSDQNVEEELEDSQVQQNEIDPHENAEEMNDVASRLLVAFENAKIVEGTDRPTMVQPPIEDYPLMDRLNSVVRMHIWKFLLKLPASDKGWTPNEVSHISYAEPRMLKGSLVVNKDYTYELNTRHLTATLRGRQITTAPINQFLAITQVNKELRREAMRMYFNINQFHFDDPITLQNFLLGLPNFRHMITRLSFSYVPPLHKTIAFKETFRFLHTTNLTHLDLHIDEMAVMSRGEGYPGIQKMPGMPELHRLRGIKKLNILGPGGQQAKKPTKFSKPKIRVDRQEQEENWRTKLYLSIVTNKIGCKADQDRPDQKDLRRPRSEPLDLIRQLKEVAKATSAVNAIELRDIVKEARQDRKDAERDAKQRKADRDKAQRAAAREQAKQEREEEKEAERQEKEEQREIKKQARDAKRARDLADKKARAEERLQDRAERAAAKQAEKDLKALQRDRERRKREMAKTLKGKKPAKVQANIREDTDDSEGKPGESGEESSDDDPSDPDSDVEEEQPPPKKRQKVPKKQPAKKIQLKKGGRRG